jgi:hypothetical protein
VRQGAAGVRLSNLRTTLKIGHNPIWFAPSLPWRSQSKSKDSTISLSSGSRTACTGVPPPAWESSGESSLNLFLDHFLDSASRLRIIEKGFDVFVVSLRQCFKAFPPLGEHFVCRLNDCVLVGGRRTEPLFDFCAKAFGAILGIHFGNQRASGNFDIPEDRDMPAWNFRIAFLALVKCSTPWLSILARNRSSLLAAIAKNKMVHRHKK